MSDTNVSIESPASTRVQSPLEVFGTMTPRTASTTANGDFDTIMAIAQGLIQTVRGRDAAYNTERAQVRQD